MSTRALFTDDLDSVAESLDAAAAQQDERLLLLYFAAVLPAREALASCSGGL